MRLLSDIVLIECYLDSLVLELDYDFIELLITEMKERNINIPSMSNEIYTCSDHHITAYQSV
jgi:hypothetical protein